MTVYRLRHRSTGAWWNARYAVWVPTITDATAFEFKSIADATAYVIVDDPRDVAVLTGLADEREVA